MPPFARKPKTTLSVTEMALSIEQRHKLMFDGWIDECVGIQEAFIEGLLALMPSLKDAE